MLVIAILTAMTGDNAALDSFSNIIDFMASMFNLCVMILLIEARRTRSPFTLNVALSKSVGYLPGLLLVFLLTTLVILLGTILLIVPGIIAAIGLCIAAPVYVSENHTGISQSLKRSWQLTKTHRLNIALIYLPVIGGVLLMITAMVTLPETATILWLETVVYTLIGSLMTFFFNLFSIFIYTTLREVKEGQTPDVTAAVFD